MKNKHIKYHQYKKIIRKLIILRNVIKHKILITIINIHLIKLVEYNQQNQILEKICNYEYYLIKLNIHNKKIIIIIIIIIIQII
jgi:hypothetical protein